MMSKPCRWILLSVLAAGFCACGNPTGRNAGGLDPENAGPAVRMLHPFVVDVSSGIETEGVKDPEKMKAFVSAVRAEGHLD